MKYTKKPGDSYTLFIAVCAITAMAVLVSAEGEPRVGIAWLFVAIYATISQALMNRCEEAIKMADECLAGWGDAMEELYKNTRPMTDEEKKISDAYFKSLFEKKENKQ